MLNYVAYVGSAVQRVLCVYCSATCPVLRSYVCILAIDVLMIHIATTNVNTSMVCVCEPVPWCPGVLTLAATFAHVTRAGDITV